MKRTVVFSMFLAGLIVFGASAVTVTKDSGYANSVMLEDFSGTTDVATSFTGLVFDGSTGGAAQ